MLRERLLDKLTDPNLAVLCLIIGGLLIYLEFNVPGTIVPGALGTLLVCISLFALNLLPVRYTAVMLIVGAFALLLLEAKFASHGVLAGAGTLCLVFGLLTLVNGPIPELRVHPATAIAAGAAFALITVFVVRLALRARRNKSLMGVDALIGLTAIAQQPLSPGGPGARPRRALASRISHPRRARRKSPGARRAQPHPVGRPDSRHCSGAN